MKTTIIILFVLSFGANALLWRRVAALEKASGPTNDFPLGETMGYMQRYADKLWYAAESGNWDLAHYYHDEMKETAETIESANVAKDDVAISKTLHLMLPPALQSVDEAIAARNAGQFRERYQSMVATCNACHVAAKHPFIHIAVPGGPPAQWNQDFSVHP